MRLLISSKRVTMHANYLEAQIKLALKDYAAAQHLIQEGLALAEMLGAKEDGLRFVNLQTLIRTPAIDEMIIH